MTRRDPLGDDVFLIAWSFLFLNHNLAAVSFCVTALFPNLRFVVVRGKKNNLSVQYIGFPKHILHFLLGMFRSFVNTRIKKPPITQCPNVGLLRKSFASRVCVFLKRFSRQTLFCLVYLKCFWKP